MKGREGKGPPSTDLLVCFPSRAHLTLMPKPICSPARHQDTNKRQHHHPCGVSGGHLNHHHHVKKSINRNKVAGHASPVLWAKNKSSYGKEIDEPTSPKVTCAGQIKVKPKASSCKNWQSVMEEMERLHNHRKNKKRATWVEALGFKKDVMQFLTCLRSIRFDFQCFGAFPSSSITSDDEDEVDDGVEDDEHDEFHQQGQQGSKESIRDDLRDTDQSSSTVFSKWFMVLQENNSSTKKEMINNRDINRLIGAKFSHGDHEAKADDDDDVDEAPCAPPPNALLLMRCRSAPPKSWIEQKEVEVEEEEEDDDNDEYEDENEKKRQREEEETMEEEKNKKKKDHSILMRCGTDFNKFSSDVARETWVVGGIKEALSRSRSWKR